MARIVMMLLCVVVTCMVVASPYAEAAITCDQVISQLAPCVGYLTTGGVVPQACCNGVKGLNAAAQSRPDRKAACSCLKSAYASVAGIKPRNASSLPSKCGVNIPYKISPSTDCTKVQ